MADQLDRLLSGVPDAPAPAAAPPAVDPAGRGLFVLSLATALVTGEVTWAESQRAAVDRFQIREHLRSTGLIVADESYTATRATDALTYAAIIPFLMAEESATVEEAHEALGDEHDELMQKLVTAGMAVPVDGGGYRPAAPVALPIELSVLRQVLDGRLEKRREEKAKREAQAKLQAEIRAKAEADRAANAAKEKAAKEKAAAEQAEREAAAQDGPEAQVRRARLLMKVITDTAPLSFRGLVKAWDEDAAAAITEAAVKEGLVKRTADETSFTFNSFYAPDASPPAPLEPAEVRDTVRATLNAVLKGLGAVPETRIVEACAARFGEELGPRYMAEARRLLTEHRLITVDEAVTPPVWHLAEGISHKPYSVRNALWTFTNPRAGLESRVDDEVPAAPRGLRKRPQTLEEMVADIRRFLLKSRASAAAAGETEPVTEVSREQRELMLELAAAIAAYGPRTMSQLKKTHTTAAKRHLVPDTLKAALAMGVFTVPNGKGGARYSLGDVSPLGITEDELATAAEAKLARRQQVEALIQSKRNQEIGV